MDFKNASELLALCAQQQLPVSEIMRRRERATRSRTA